MYHLFRKSRIEHPYWKGIPEEAWKEYGQPKSRQFLADLGKAIPKKTGDHLRTLFVYLLDSYLERYSSQVYARIDAASFIKSRTELWSQFSKKVKRDVVNKKTGRVQKDKLVASIAPNVDELGYITKEEASWLPELYGFAWNEKKSYLECPGWDIELSCLLPFIGLQTAAQRARFTETGPNSADGKEIRELLKSEPRTWFFSQKWGENAKVSICLTEDED